MPEEFREAIDRFMVRPEMALGERSVLRLEAFLNGYTTAKYNLPAIAVEPLGSFQSFLQTKYGHPNKTWTKILLFESLDDSDAFQQFINNWSEFLDASPQ